MIEIVSTKETDITVYNENYVDKLMINEDLYPGWAYYHAKESMCCWAVPLELVWAIDKVQKNLAEDREEFLTMLDRKQARIDKLADESTDLKAQLEESQKSTQADRGTLLELVNANLSTDNIIKLRHNGII